MGGSDELVERLLINNRAIVASLDVSRNELDNKMPQMSSAIASQVTPIRNELVSLLKELDVLRKSISNDDIVSDLIHAGCGVPADALVPSETKNGTIEKWNSTKEKKLFVKLKKKT